MKINDSNLLGAAQTNTAKTQETVAPSTGRGSSSSSSGALGSDSFQISNLGSSLRSLASESPDRTGQVASLAGVYQSGSYKIDSSAVSHSLVNDSIRS